MEKSLVISKGKKVVTDSLTVAEESGKKHDFVLRKIKSLINDDEKDLLIFTEMSYRDSYGRPQKKYIMDRRSFSILCMRFTGKKALIWQNRFYDAFEAMEKKLLQQKNFSWQQSRIEGKETRLEFTDALKKVVEFADVSGSKKPDIYYTTFTRMIYSLLFDLKKVPKNFRDTLDKETLKQLQMIEWKASQWIEQAITHSKDYHEPYYEVKAKVQSLVDVIGNLKLYEEITA